MYNVGLVTDWINREYGININAAYYERVREWKEWWKGYRKPFHSYTERLADGNIRKRKLYSMNMAKKISEDWASILFNDKTTISVADRAAERLLLGSDEVVGVLDRNNFTTLGNQAIEKAFASGTAALVLRAEGIEGDDSGYIGNESTRIVIESVESDHIIPLSTKGDSIEEVVFASEVSHLGEEYIYIESHLLEDGEYVIRNKYFKVEEGKLIETQLPDGIAPEIRTGSNIKLFSILKPNILNNIDRNHSLGISIYANAIDNLMGVDLAFNNFCRDFKLGGKKVFVNEELVKMDERGNLITPDDVAQQLFMTVGDSSLNEGQGTDIWEHNPELRVKENADGIQAQLDYLAFMCGLGSKFYQFNGGTVATTATQYKGERQDLAKNTRKHEMMVDQAFKDIFRAILFIGNRFIDSSIDYECDILIDFDDGYISDREAENLRALQDVRDGIMAKYEYRMKAYGEDEETARKKIAEIEGRQEVSLFEE